jgi:hypothetical protein
MRRGVYTAERPPITHKQRTRSPLNTDELTCPCGITFEPLPWFDADLDEPVCDECGDAA